MDIEINQVKIAASWECNECGELESQEIWHDITSSNQYVTNNDIMFSRQGLIQRVFDSDCLAGWDLEDSLCPSCNEEDN